MKYKIEELFTLRREAVSSGHFLIVNGDDFISNSPHKLANYKYAEFPNKNLQKSGYKSLFCKGDILFLTIGAKKKIWIADREGVCASGNNKIKIIIARKTIVLPHYLINILTSEKITKWAFNCLTGTTVPQIDWEVFVSKEILIPTIIEQQNKFDVFFQLKEYLTKQQELVEKLKRLCKTIVYKYFWKAQKFRKLGEIASFEYGYTAKASDKGKYRFLQTGDIDRYGNILDQEKKYIDLPENIDENKYLLNKGDIITARHGNCGRTVFFQSNEKTIFTNDLIRIKLNKQIILPKYYWYFSQTQEYWKQVKDEGTAQPQFNANSLEKVLVPIIGQEEQRKVIADLDQRIDFFLTTLYLYVLANKYVDPLSSEKWKEEQINLIKLSIIG